MNLEDLKEQIRQCTKCELCTKMPLGQPVPGIGPNNAKLMIVGEALGKDEALLEEPFVGLCGKFLTNCMAIAGINRQDCYITNSVKCRPTDTGTKNRPPSKDELNVCKDWLFKEIELIKPKFIVALGKVAAETIFRHKIKNMKEIVGKTGFYISGDASWQYQFLATWHPSYVQNYSKGCGEEFIEHLKKAKKVAYGL